MNYMYNINSGRICNLLFPMLKLVVCHLPKKIQKFQMGKHDFLKGKPKFPNRISEWKMCIPFASLYCLVPGLLAWIVFDPIFWGKVLQMERAHPTESFHLVFDTYHLQQLSTNRFFQVNCKQSLTLQMSDSIIQDIFTSIIHLYSKEN